MDDDAQLRQLLIRILDTGDYAVAAVADAFEARKQLSDRDYAVILIDALMPGESGIDLLKYMRSERMDTAAIIVTALDDPSLFEAAFEAGAYGYVVKPFRVNDVLITISKALERRDLEIQSQGHLQKRKEE